MIFDGGVGGGYNVSGQKCLLGKWIISVTTIHVCIKKVHIFLRVLKRKRIRKKKKKAVTSTPDKPFRNLTMGKFQI